MLQEWRIISVLCRNLLDGALGGRYCRKVRFFNIHYYLQRDTGTIHKKLLKVPA